MFAFLPGCLTQNPMSRPPEIGLDELLIGATERPQDIQVSKDHMFNAGGADLRLEVCHPGGAAACTKHCYLEPMRIAKCFHLPCFQR